MGRVLSVVVIIKTGLEAVDMAEGGAGGRTVLHDEQACFTVGWVNRQRGT